MILQFVPIRIFREKTQVSFFDARIDGSNGSDVVIHHKNAISPPGVGEDLISQLIYLKISNPFSRDTKIRSCSAFTVFSGGEESNEVQEATHGLKLKTKKR
tara:strand:- start:268 stop:570 length:303 start_codon:yes stop_codon:yes gene_type:complete